MVETLGRPVVGGTVAEKIGIWRRPWQSPSSTCGSWGFYVRSRGGNDTGCSCTRRTLGFWARGTEPIG